MAPSLTLWTPPPETLELTRAQVHLWRFRLDLSHDKIAELTQLLSEDEQTRAERLLDRTKSHHFIAARARLRQILSRYLNQQPEELAFTYGEHGKPSLLNDTGKKITFNLSHAGRWGVLAVTRAGEIGVDIEQIDPDLDYNKIASGFFSTAEIDRLNQSPPHRRRRIFYRIWTRKEAGLKANGGGFSSPATTTVSGWRISSFTVDRSHLGATVLPRAISSIQRWDLN